jgi:hypothetical protein
MDCGAPALLGLTGPVGQPIASRLGGQGFASRGCIHTSGTGILLLALSR